MATNKRDRMTAEVRDRILNVCLEYFKGPLATIHTRKVEKYCELYSVVAIRSSGALYLHPSVELTNIIESELYKKAITLSGEDKEYFAAHNDWYKKEKNKLDKLKWPLAEIISECNEYQEVLYLLPDALSREVEDFFKHPKDRYFEPEINKDAFKEKHKESLALLDQAIVKRVLYK
jgi:hypothetical protein